MYCTEINIGPQWHNVVSPVFMHCVVLKVQLFVLMIPSIKASCLAEASNLVEGIGITAVSREPYNDIGVCIIVHTT